MSCLALRGYFVGRLPTLIVRPVCRYNTGSSGGSGGSGYSGGSGGSMYSGGSDVSMEYGEGGSSVCSGGSLYVATGGLATGASARTLAAASAAASAISSGTSSSSSSLSAASAVTAGGSDTPTPLRATHSPVPPIPHQRHQFQQSTASTSFSCGDPAPTGTTPAFSDSGHESSVTMNVDRLIQSDSGQLKHPLCIQYFLA